MTLLDAPAYDARRARLIRNSIITVLIAVVVLAIGTWWFWDWPAQHRVNRFFVALQSGDLKKAYSIWNNDPNWEQHQDQYKLYDFIQFTKDWGPEGDYGVIKSHQIVISKAVGNGVVMGVTINGGKTPIFLRVDRKSRQIGFSPIELYVGP
ncbi:MAG TPA: hypothetical protein VHT24_17430 [Pseudacidobacterium sp.]|jgi:hypothetical protein|nr:hypothetical protein [Pseudacidobacterium sp.]